MSRSLRIAVEAHLLSSGLDPLYLYPSLNAALLTGLLGHPAEGLSMIDRILVLEPDMPVAQWYRSVQLVLLGKREEASALLERLEALAAEERLDRAEFEMMRDLLVVQTRNADEWRPAVDRLLTWRKARFYILQKELLAMILSGRGESEAALEALAHRGPRPSVPPYDWFMLCPYLKPLRGDPRFPRIAAEARSEFEKTLATLDEARSRREFPPYLEKPLAALLADLGISPRR